MPYVEPLLLTNSEESVGLKSVDIATAAADLLALFFQHWQSKEFRFCLIDGASGSGKTRLGYELFRKLRGMKDRFHLAHVAYSYFLIKDAIDIADPRDTRAAELVLRQHLIASHCQSPEEMDARVSFRDIVRAAAVAASPVAFAEAKCVALVVHLDEMQRAPKLTAAMLRVMRDFNMDEALRGKLTLLLPVATGLVADDVNSFITDVTGSLAIRYLLPYFDVLDDAMPATWRLVQAAARPALDQFKELQDAPKLLQLLVRSTAGWPFAAAQLGVSAVIFFNAERPEFDDLLHGNSRSQRARSLLIEIQSHYTVGVRAWYSCTSLLTSLELAIGGEGAHKLRCLLLSPHSVRLWHVSRWGLALGGTHGV